MGANSAPIAYDATTPMTVAALRGGEAIGVAFSGSRLSLLENSFDSVINGGGLEGESLPIEAQGMAAFSPELKLQAVRRPLSNPESRSEWLGDQAA